MAWTRVSGGVAGAAAIGSAFLTMLTIWLLLTEPATLAAAVDRGTIAPVVRVLLTALVDFGRLLLRLL